MNEPDRVRSVDITNLHGNYNLSLDFDRALTVLEGRNGTGKTTLLHILANLIDGDLLRFASMRFDHIIVNTFGGLEIQLERRAGASEDVPTVRLPTRDPVSIVEGPALHEVEAELRAVFKSRPVYLPAFRSILEAVSRARLGQPDSYSRIDPAEFTRLVERESARPAQTTETRPPVHPNFAYRTRHHRAEAIAAKTVLCRQWFGGFTPTIRAPSLAEVEHELSDELGDAQFKVQSHDLRSLADVFANVLRAVLEPHGGAAIKSTEALLTSIRSQLAGLEAPSGVTESAYSMLAGVVSSATEAPIESATVPRVLQVYDSVLQDRIATQRKAFERLRTFQTSVNRFLEDKTLDLDADAGPTRTRLHRFIKLSNGKRATMSALSSGERQVVTLLFSATHMSPADGALLVDEPELSLHVDWQRIILGELLKQAGDRQIIACTHSPEVGADHPTVKRDLLPTTPGGTPATLPADLGSDDSTEV